jgi:hypothetical protein
MMLVITRPGKRILCPPREGLDYKIPVLAEDLYALRRISPEPVKKSEPLLLLHVKNQEKLIGKKFPSRQITEWREI